MRKTVIGFYYQISKGEIMTGQESTYISKIGLGIIKFLFDFYKKCYSIDEVSRKLTTIKKTTIEKFSKDISNTNLVLVSKPSHVKLIEELVVKGI